MNWIDLSVKDRINVLETLKVKLKIDAVSIEKDWWVTMVLKALFTSVYASHLSFKGGTSLSKCFHLINRFSEDVDISINREFLGFGGQLSKTQISDKLRRATCSFVRETLMKELENQLLAIGIKKEFFEVKVNLTSVTTTDPETIEVHYKSAFSDFKYIQNKVLIEVSGRSMIEPVEVVEICSMITECIPNTPYSDKPFPLTAVSPKRTFLEKCCLLHEEFSQKTRQVRSSRMTRHLYDLERMMDTAFANEALEDRDLYKSIIEHRKKFIGLNGFDYSELLPNNISFVPPVDVMESWRSDYNSMRESMIYGDPLTFDELINRIKDLNARFKLIKEF